MYRLISASFTGIGPFLTGFVMNVRSFLFLTVVLLYNSDATKEQKEPFGSSGIRQLAFQNVFGMRCIALCGKMSKREEDFFCSACYTSQEAPLTGQRPDDQS